MGSKPFMELRESRHEAVRRGTCFPINGRRGLYIWCYSKEHNGQRFARLFAETLNKIPLGRRRELFKYWRTSPCWGTADLSGLKIEVVDALFMTDGDHRPSFGCVKRAGFEVKFNGDEVIAMPDNVVWDLIAHELAHVVQYAWGITKPSRMEEGYPIYELPSGEEWYQGDLENHADDLISEWGFDPESIDNWSIGTGRTVVREVSLEEYMESVARFELTGWR